MRSLRLCDDDIFIAKLDITTGIQEYQGEDVISIYPNPSTSQLSIINSTLSIKEVHIYNVLGEEILNDPEKSSGQNDQSVKIDVSGFAKGIYFVQITDEKKNVMNRKIIVN